MREAGKRKRDVQPGRKGDVTAKDEAHIVVQSWDRIVVDVLACCYLLKYYICKKN